MKPLIEVKNLNVIGEITVIAISRNNKAFIPTLGAEFHPADVIHCVVLSAAMERFRDMAGLGEGGA